CSESPIHLVVSPGFVQIPQNTGTMTNPRLHHIRTKGRITGALEKGAYRAALPNGKIVFAFPAKDLDNLESLRVGERIVLELNPYDFSKARIVEENS
ncbi:MAG: hypothetical protein ACC661_08970, partial [Verrucomicrobiales bacterium]